jgi:hypothetical protein
MTLTKPDGALGDGQWLITLLTGEVLRVRGTGFSREDGHYVFSGLEVRKPPRIVDIAWIPEHLVRSVRGPVDIPGDDLFG